MPPGSAPTLKAPIPLNNKQLESASMPKKLRSNSTSEDTVSKRPKFLAATPDFSRARSATPRIPSLDHTKLAQRLAHYNLDYSPNPETYARDLVDPNSRFYARKTLPKVNARKLLPYAVESHTDQAAYLCHILIHLYIAINSLDIQGLLNISARDLATLQRDVNELTIQTDLFQLTADDDLAGDIGALNDDDVNFDEDAVEEEEDDDQEEDEPVPGSSSAGRLTAKSATIINVNHWTNELKNCLHFEFPVTLRKSLVTVYYYLSLVQGQKVYRQLYVELLNDLVNPDDEGENLEQLLVENGLVLDYKPLLSFLDDFLPTSETEYDRYDVKEDHGLFKNVMRVADLCNPFFDGSDSLVLTTIFDHLLSRLSPTTMNSVMAMLGGIAPVHYNQKKTTDYFEPMFNIWSSHSPMKSLDANMFDLLSRVAEVTYKRLVTQEFPDFTKSGCEWGQYGLMNGEQMDFIWNRLLNYLRGEHSSGNSVPISHLLVYSISEQHFDAFYTQLHQLFQSLQTFAHPSNSGRWSKTIGKIVHGFIKGYHGRHKLELNKGKFRKELHLSYKSHAKILDCFTELVFTGSQSKDDQVANYYISSMAYLVDLNSENNTVIFDRVVVDVYDSLADSFVNSSHRTLVSLKELIRIVRFMVDHPVYRLHITNLLSMLLNKVNVVDLKLSANIYNAVATIFSFVPLENFTTEDDYLSFESHTMPFIQEHFMFLKDGGNTNDFVYDEEFAQKAFLASTTVFDSIVKTFTGKLFELADADLSDRFKFKLYNTVAVMVESMSEPMFKKFVSIYEEFLWETEYMKDSDANFELVTRAVAAIVNRDDCYGKHFFEKITSRIHDEVEKGAGSIRTNEIQPRDIKLTLYISLLNDVLKYSRRAILTFEKEFNDLIDFLYETIKNPMVHVLISLLVCEALTGVTNISIVEARLLVEGNTLSPTEKWGALQFDPRRFDQLNFKWYTPDTAEINFAIDTFELWVNKQIDTLETLKIQEKDSSRADLMIRSIMTLGHLFAGMSVLFDPDYNRIEIDRESAFQKKLLSLKRGLKADSEEINVDIELVGNQNDEADMQDFKETESFDGVALSDDLNVVVDDYLSDQSPLCSGMVTPGGPSSFGGASVLLNSSLTFRDLSIYQCNYFFGNDQNEKLQNPLYQKLHKIRNDAGEYFHELFEYLTEHEDTNVKLFQTFLHALKIWFVDVGMEGVFQDQTSNLLDAEFMESIQTLGHLEEPFTRTCFAARVQTYHNARLLLHSTNRIPSKLEKKLLDDITLLSMSVYPNIHKPAEVTLVHTMKKLIGSYSLVLKKTLSQLQVYIENKDVQHVAVALRTIRLKKINRKVMSDYKNLAEIVGLVLQAIKLNDEDVTTVSEKILQDLGRDLKIPSSVCKVDSRGLTAIRPFDPYIDLEVATVKEAKETKRQIFLEKLQQLSTVVSESLNEVHNWRISKLLIDLLTNLESTMEFSSRIESLRAILGQASTKHPYILQDILRFSTRMYDKLISLHIYNYDIYLSIDSDFVRPTMKTITMEEYEKRQGFYIDARPYVGWFTSTPDTKFQVIKTDEQIQLKLKENEVAIFKEMGQTFSLNWVKEVLSTLAQANEAKSYFSSLNVNFFSLLVHLIATDNASLSYDDLLTLLKETYDKDDKPSIILCAEIFTALLMATKHTKDEHVAKRDMALSAFLDSIVATDLSNDNVHIWAIVYWWVSGHCDFSRYPFLFQSISNLNNLIDVHGHDAAKQAGRLSFLKSFVNSIGSYTPDLDKMVSSLNFAHPYDQVRHEMADLFVTLIFASTSPAKGSSKAVDAKIKELFTELQVERENVVGLSPQDSLKSKYYYMATTALYWIHGMSNGFDSKVLTKYVKPYIAPFLLEMDQLRDLCKLGNVKPSQTFIELACLPYSPSELGDVIAVSLIPMTSPHSIRVQMTCLQTFFSLYMMQLSRDQKQQILDFVVGNLYYPHVEVRSDAAHILAGLIHSISADEQLLQGLIDKFTSELDTVGNLERRKEMANNVEIHGSTIGLGAVISAFPYVFPLPKWIPEKLSLLASWARANGASGAAAKDVISNFKKVRSDTWHLDRYSFNSDQLEDLEGVLWRSYYA